MRPCEIIYGQDPKGWKWRAHQRRERARAQAAAAAMMNTASAVEAQGWPSERLEGLNRDELTNLQANAQWLGKPALAALCAQLLTHRARRGAGRRGR